MLQSSYICGEIANQTKNNEAYNRTKIGNSSRSSPATLGVSRRGRWSFNVPGLNLCAETLGGSKQVARVGDDFLSFLKSAQIEKCNFQTRFVILNPSKQ